MPTTMVVTDSHPTRPRPTSLPRWLVSVRTLDEATTAASAGADIVDFKEPSGGALAPTTPKLWQQAATSLSHCELSAALGESHQAAISSPHVPSTFTFAKMGPGGVVNEDALCRHWSALSLPENVQLVAVAYADHVDARCLTPQQVLNAARRYGLRHCLIDTHGKNGLTLTDHLSVDRLQALIEQASQNDIAVLLAGSLSLAVVGQLDHAGVRPFGWGVRGDVCEADSDTSQRRVGRLCRDRLRSWRDALTATSTICLTLLSGI